MTSRRYLYVGLVIIALCLLAVAVAAFGQTALPESVAPLGVPQATPIAPPGAPQPAPAVPTVTLRRFADEPLLLSGPSSKAEQVMLEIANTLRRNGCVLQTGIVIGAGDSKRPYVRVVEQAPAPAQVPAGS